MKYVIILTIAYAVVCNAANLYVPYQYANIQTAINNAQSGDSVILADGLWFGLGNNDLVITGKDITLKSENGPDNCIVTGPVLSSALSMLAISNCNDITLDGIAFRNCDKRAVFANIASSFTVKNCNFSNIAATYNPSISALRFTGTGAIVLEGCDFSNNVSDGSYSCLYLSSASMVNIDNCSFTANTSKQGTGGAVTLTNITNGATITNSSFINNRALSREGGAVYADNTNLVNAQLNISGCLFEGNSGTKGGAIWANAYSNYITGKYSTIVDCVFKNNRAQTGSGGALYSYSNSIFTQIEGCTFESNEAATYGGGIYFESGAASSKLQVGISNNIFASNTALNGSVIYSGPITTTKRNFIISNCDIYDNQSTYECIFLMHTAEISTCRIFENKARTVADIGDNSLTYETYPLLRNCLIYKNTTYDTNPMTLIYLRQNAIIKSCTIADNEGTTFFRNSGRYFEVTNSIVYNNGGTGNNYAIADMKDKAIIKNSCIDSYQGTNIQASAVISADPLLMTGGRLGAGSPCIDAGLNGEAGDFDLDGKPRIIGQAVDMGAYEFSIRPDIDNSGAVDMGDVAQLAANWNLAQPDYTADVNDDGVIDSLDINAMAADWLVDIANMPLDHLQCRYEFDETAGLIAKDSSPRGRDAIVYNQSNFWKPGEGVEGGCAYIGSTTRYLTINGYRGIVGSDSRTTCFWMKTSDNDGILFSWGTSYTSRQKWLFRVSEVTNSLNQTGGTLRIEIGGGNIVSDTIINDSQWHHIAVVFDHDQSINISDAIIYIDGVASPVLSVTNNTVDTFGANYVQIGAFTYGSLYGADAYIDDFRIYDKALSQQEITDIQQSQGQ